MNTAKTSVILLSLLAIGVAVSGCATDNAAVSSAEKSPPVWNRKSATPFSADEAWPNLPWEDTYRPAEFIKIKPSVQPVADGVIAIRWKTSDFAKSWVEVSQDGGKTWKECWKNVDGMKEVYGTDFTAIVSDYDMTKPLKYKVRARQIENIDTWGNHKFFGEEWLGGAFTGGYYPVGNYRAQIAARREKYTGEEFVEEGELKAVDPANFDIVMVNDIHHTIGYYPKLLKQLGDKTAIIVLAGDICDHSRSRQDFEKHLEAPMAYLSKHANCMTTYLRGNHETWGLYAAYLRNHFALHRIDVGEAMYGAYTIGNTRFAFIDTANDETSTFDPKSHRELNWEYEPYLAEEAAWLERESASAKWKSAQNHVAFAHIPWGYYPTSPLSTTIMPAMAKSGISLFCAGHEHHAKLYPKNVPFGKKGDRVYPYDIAVGGGPRQKPEKIDPAKPVGVSWPTAVIVSVRNGKLSVSCKDISGENVY